MPNLRDIKRKIEAVKKIGQITRAMNMVAAAKLRGAQERVEQFRPYATKFREVVTELAASGAVNPAQFELMQPREVKKVEIILVTADRGLCGAFNANLINACERFIREQKAKGREVSLICVGRKGAQFYRKSGLIRESYEDVMSRVEMFNARAIAREAMRAFLDKEVDETHIIYGYFINVVRQIPKIDKLLPIAVEKEEAAEETTEPKISGSYIYEPEPEELFAQILPLYINTQVFAAMLETAVSEQAARMTAMDNANRACGDMVHSLTLLFNKTRQAAITKELMDIVGGAEALKG
ncbi:ATP synthase F1 subunit gamma [Thermodesulfatator atlanticus]|uniref:ATP synthase F1 subunit gamma n=1 Tax=Thermodesulfatator atlanticus TaxID=501497 RepID=UPI0003B69819|nr:ATP synthase F1 subunit gamma [Thermodesulfatator atlanticus]